MPRTRHALVAGLAVAGLLLSSCGSSDSTASDTTKAPSTKTTTTKPAAEKLKVLVTNDDGYQGEGIDAVVTGLKTLPDIEIQVVAPLENQSGTGGKTSAETPAVTDVTLADGQPAKAVDGYPADAVGVALGDLGLKPDLVVSGINAGQNLGPAADISGTVGAARAAVAEGIPALAVSQGTGTTFDYPAAVSIVLDWVQDHREALLSGDAPAQVDNINVPSCAGSDLRGLVEVEADLAGDIGESLAVQDCTSTEPFDKAAGDVTAFLNGYATHSILPATAGSK